MAALVYVRSETQLSGHRGPYSRHHPHRATSDVGRGIASQLQRHAGVARQCFGVG